MQRISAVVMEKHVNSSVVLSKILKQIRVEPIWNLMAGADEGVLEDCGGVSSKKAWDSRIVE